jgi:4-hydroxy-2-oxoglutarate aldolase
MHTKIDLKGIYPAVTTPFAANRSVALPRLRENIVRYNKTRVAGFVVNGSTGESVLLKWEEIEHVWEAVRKLAAPGKILIAGTAAESTAETIEHTNRAAAMGCDVALVRTPHFFKPQMTPTALVEFYLRVADAAKIPVLVYSVPIFTQLKLQADVVGRVAQHPNIIGMKDSSGDAKGVKDILAAVPKSFQMLVGSVAVLHEALQMKAVGAILAVACAFPDLCVEVYEASLAGDSARAIATQQKLVSAANLFGPKYGIAGLKYVMDSLGYYGGPPRPPLLPVDEAAKKDLDAMLASVAEPVSGD